jgi:hypothetical protein
MQKVATVGSKARDPLPDVRPHAVFLHPRGTTVSQFSARAPILTRPLSPPPIPLPLPGSIPSVSVSMEAAPAKMQESLFVHSISWSHDKKHGKT